MTISQSSAAIAAELQALLTAMSSTAQVYFYDANGDFLASAPLPNPPGTLFDNQIVLLGMPVAITVASSAPVGAIPETASIVNASGVQAVPLITGLPVIFQPNAIVIASSSVNPGGQLGVLGGAIVIP